VAGQWRIRHKLMLGLGLVVGIMALLLAGTLKGLMSYRATMKSIDSKLAELEKAEVLKAAVDDLAPQGRAPARGPGDGTSRAFAEVPGTIVDPDTSSNEDLGNLQQKVKEAESALRSYEEKLQDTLLRGRDPDKGYKEIELIKQLKTCFERLKKSAKALEIPRADHNQGSKPLMDDLDVQEAIRELVTASNGLHEAIYSDLYTRTTVANRDYRNSLIIVLSTSVLGVLLMAGLLRFFYGWVFYPIRDLEQGAGRVAQGDFEHRIEVHSGDEMEDLAAAFNHMTARLREIYTDLAHQVNERSRQLVRSERLAGVGFLAAGVAHEINNPLASIAFCSEALERRLASLVHSPERWTTDNAQRTADEEVVTKYLKMIQQEAFRCKAITQRLLEFSRGGERRREPTDLAELVQAVLDMVQHLQNCKGKTIVFEPAGRLVAWVNDHEIKSVVLNLVVNALDSMDDGGTLTITLGQRDGMAILEFADNGCGMAPDILENIFEPFFTRSRTGKGTGLGLAISHRVINQHGGEIEAVSPGPNQGSTFTVRLPLQPAEPVKEETVGHAAA
jgi:signal transduction histidine kinase